MSTIILVFMVMMNCLDWQYYLTFALWCLGNLIWSLSKKLMHWAPWISYKIIFQASKDPWFLRLQCVLLSSFVQENTKKSILCCIILQVSMYLPGLSIIKALDGILTLKCTKCAVGWPKYMKACAPCLAL